jgi:hypothetical protein
MARFKTTNCDNGNKTDVLGRDVHESVHRDLITKTANKMQLCRLIYYSLSALHVSGNVSAHHREHLTVFTAYGNIQSSAPDDGRKHRPKHVELTRNNKLTYIAASCWLFSS